MSLPEGIAAAKARADATPLTAKIIALPSRYPFQYDEQKMLTHAQTMEADRAALLAALREFLSADLSGDREVRLHGARAQARNAIAQAEGRS